MWRFREVAVVKRIVKKCKTEMLDCPSGRHNSLNIGSLSNDDGDGNDNGKKGNRFGLAKQQLCTCSTLFGTLISFQ